MGRQMTAVDLPWFWCPVSAGGKSVVWVVFRRFTHCLRASKKRAFQHVKWLDLWSGSDTVSLSA